MAFLKWVYAQLSICHNLSVLYAVDLLECAAAHHSRATGGT